MRIYWTLGAEPSLRAIPRSERSSVFREVTRKHVGVGRRLLYALPAGIAAGLGAWVGHGVTQGSLLGAAFVVPGAWIGAVVGNSLMIRRVSPFLAEVVAARRQQKPEA